MTRKLFLLATGLFWLVVLGVWAASSRSPAPGEATPVRAMKRLPLTEVARHSSAGDCWMAIHGKVYDLTAYLPDHPTRPSVILPWCGKEASEAYRTKTKGRPHSAEADRLLAGYQIGVLEEGK
ncbi:MAG: cytochrome b5 domain-containing protein [Candidatus Accumulibacter sp.]|uniref:cytochrome b5 domain-containing protein n=1 Tax=Accumulibacter sp. TaxID=2053492 RepID=UPI0025CEE718|nr:cytochrome b5-like heme/steroid binding domain-containing protein [Accumulibacter sp.]MCM8599080.1 cytochrome b5 domain-containing protein [Accumulibacter sp.]MCM8663122.1 cytochrome b5 domain-containing protein [Accumulibacter sp.]